MTPVPREGTAGDGQPSMGAVVAGGGGRRARADARLLGGRGGRAGVPGRRGGARTYYYSAGVKCTVDLIRFMGRQPAKV